MKRRINQLSLLGLLLIGLIPARLMAAGLDETDKKKTISKTYTVGSSDKLNIENSFGKVTVLLWDQNVITVDIEIGTSAYSEEKAQSMLNEITVSDSQIGQIIYFKTKVGNIGNSGKNKKSDNEKKFYIDYTVHMPGGNPLAIENSFGSITVPDFKGPVSLTSKFGSLNAGNLDNVEDISVEFGSATIGKVHNGKISIKYSSSSMDNLSGSVKLVSEFSGKVSFQLDNEINDLQLNESYSSIRIQVNKSLSAHFNIHTSFGNFQNSTDFPIKEENEDEDGGPHFDKDYSGQSGDGKAKIKIRSSFGHIRLSDNAADKDKDDDREENTKQKKA